MSRFRTALVAAFVAVIGVSSTAAAGILGPEGQFSTFISNLEWKPSCSKPMRPIGNDEWAWDSYKTDVQEYVVCTNRQAKADAEYAVEQIIEGREKALSDLRREIERGF